MNWLVPIASALLPAKAAATSALWSSRELS
jgi:hypothetical protein